MSKKDNSLVFGLGLLAGVVGGVLAGVLLAPKSGEETRKELKEAVSEVAQKCAPELREAKKQALCSIDMIRYKIEKKYNKICNSLKAKQLAKAKTIENDEYDFN